MFHIANSENSKDYRPQPFRRKMLVGHNTPLARYGTVHDLSFITLGKWPQALSQNPHVNSFLGPAVYPLDMMRIRERYPEPMWLIENFGKDPMHSNETQLLKYQ